MNKDLRYKEDIGTTGISEDVGVNATRNMSIVKSANDLNDVTIHVNDVEKAKFMELLKNGPKSEDLIDYVELSSGWFKLMLDGEYANTIVGVDLWKEPYTVYVLMADRKLDNPMEGPFIRIKRHIREDFGKRWEELACKYLQDYRLAGGIHCTN